MRAVVAYAMLPALAVAALPSLTVQRSGPVSVIPIARPAAIFTENPPALLSIPPLASAGCPTLPEPSLALYMSTGYVGLCVANVTSLTANLTAPIGFPQTDTCSIPFSGESWRSWPPNNVPLHTEWLRNYHGVFGALPIRPGTANASLLVLLHGEDKNELCWANDLLYQGTINTDVNASACFSGFHNGSFSDCGPAYNAFVSGALLPFSPKSCYGLSAPGNDSSVDLGPLVWPVSGYLNSTGGKASYGVRQPSGVVAWGGAYAYLFWIDNGFETSDVWAARAELTTSQPSRSDSNSPVPTAAQAFYSFNHVSGAWDLPALPAGFDPLNVSASLGSSSPAGSTGLGAPMFPLAPSAGAVRFSGVYGVAPCTRTPFCTTPVSSAQLRG